MRRRAPRAVLCWLLPAIVGLALAGCGHGDRPVLPSDRSALPAGLTLRDLGSVDDLRQTFNQDSGRPRLVLLVSPT